MYEGPRQTLEGLPEMTPEVHALQGCGDSGNLIS